VSVGRNDGMVIGYSCIHHCLIESKSITRTQILFYVCDKVIDIGGYCPTGCLISDV
jgi:hypothetical protein